MFHHQHLCSAIYVLADCRFITRSCTIVVQLQSQNIPWGTIASPLSQLGAIQGCPSNSATYLNVPNLHTAASCKDLCLSSQPVRTFFKLSERCFLQPPNALPNVHKCESSTKSSSPHHCRWFISTCFPKRHLCMLELCFHECSGSSTMRLLAY